MRCVGIGRSGSMRSIRCGWPIRSRSRLRPPSTRVPTCRSTTTPKRPRPLPRRSGPGVRQAAGIRIRWCADSRTVRSGTKSRSFSFRGTSSAFRTLFSPVRQARRRRRPRSCAVGRFTCRSSPKRRRLPFWRSSRFPPRRRFSMRRASFSSSLRTRPKCASAFARRSRCSKPGS